MSRVLCFGEILMRMSPDANGSWIAGHALPVYIGGAELNVATALAAWKVPVSYCTAVPDNYLSESILRHVRALGIGVDPIVKIGSRIGIYFLEQGTDLKHAAVIYDRAHSSFSSLRPGMVDWDRILRDVTLFHFSAISPALGTDTAALCLEGVKEAARRNITVSIDLNYRASLWKEREPIPVMEPLLPYCNLVMGNIWSAEKLIGIALPGEVVDDRTWYHAAARQTAQTIMQKFPACRLVCNTFRFNAGDGGIFYYATMDDAHQQYHSPVFESARILDRVGSGDCFMAGFIYGQVTHTPPAETLRLASTAAYLKMHEIGDATATPIETIAAHQASFARQ